MTVDEVKRSLRFEAKMIQRYRERIEELRNGAGSAPNLSCAPVQGGSKSDRVSRAVCEIERLEGLQKVHIDRVWNYLVFLDTQAQRDVVRLRYAEWTKWEKIAVALKYSEDHVYRLHRDAITVISDKLLTFP